MNKTLFVAMILFSNALWAATPTIVADALPNTSQCQALKTYLASPTKTIISNSIIIKHEGQTLLEWYDGTMQASSRQNLWSASKSVTAALVGVAIQDGKLSLDDHLIQYFPESVRKGLKDPNEANYSQITIRDLLQMSAGFNWIETDTNDPRTLSVLQMLWGKGHKDMLTFALRTPLLKAMPGKQWTYSSANAVILMAILRKVYGTEGESMPWTRLFDRIGMTDVTIERDAAGNYAAGSHILMPVSSMVKLGELYLNNGVYQGQQIFPANWSELTTQESEAQLSPDTPPSVVAEHGAYGLSFFLNKPVPSRNSPSLYPHAPEDMYFAAGFYGQVVIILPTEKIVIARTGHDDMAADAMPELMEKVLSCVENRATEDVSKDGRNTGGGMPFLEEIAVIQSITHNGLLAASFAKEMCTCYYVTQLPMKTCRDRNDIQGLIGLLNIQLNKKKDTFGVQAGLLLGVIDGFNEGPKSRASVYYDDASGVNQPACRLDN